MRDAFGGAFMLRIFLIFILIYILFTAIALNYAKAFKVKNLVISYLEDNEITNIENMTAISKQAMIDYFYKEIIGNLHYTHPQKLNCLEDEACLNFEDIGISIIQKVPTTTETNKRGVYYKVTTYFGFDIGFLRLLRAGNSSPDTSSDFGTWEISGETRLIVGE